MTLRLATPSAISRRTAGGRPAPGERRRPAVRRSAPILGVLLAIPVLLTACQDKPAALDPHSPEAERVASLIWTFTGLLGLIWLAVAVVSVVAVYRRHEGPRDPLVLAPAGETRRTAVVGVLVAATLLVVLGLTGLSYAAQARLFSAPEEGLVIKITGHQWWWDVQYEGDSPSRVVRTANEIHVPVGRPVLLKLEASDVIHSAWVPSLMGKIDLIPGRQNVKRLVVAKEGTYEGRCAEFCGLQHAHMGMLFVAQAPEAFDRWLVAQRAPAAAPDAPDRRSGHDAFLAKPCVMCHAVRGTPAQGQLGPDLTHLASRRTLGAGTLPMTRGALAAWVSDPHGVKPGVAMPPTPLTGPELDSMVAYLESLL